jgi:hypothetical protein
MALPCSMFISRLRLRGNWLFVLLVFPGLPYLAACGSGYHAGTVSTSVAALPGEDLAGPCTYDLTLSSPQAQQAGVLVVFERGDSAYLYADPAVQGMAAKLNLAMVYAHQCNAISTGDLQPDAAQGPGRALLLALTQFSQSTGHAELATAKVYLFGFSAAGALSMTFVNAYPNRVAGAITLAAASSTINPANIAIDAPAAQVPMLILANAIDGIAGTANSLSFFKQGRGMNARWGFGVQNETGHCCDDSVASVLVPWITEVASGTVGGTTTAESMVHFVCSPDGVLDSYGQQNCSFTAEGLGSGSAPAVNAWMPGPSTASAWLTWVTDPVQNGVSGEARFQTGNR